MEMEDIYVFGSKGFAVECAQLAKRLGCYNIKAFVECDDLIGEISEGITINSNWGVPVISERAFFQMVKTSDADFYCAIPISNPKITNKIYQSCLNAGGGRCKFPNLVDLSSNLNDVKSMGMGNIVFQNTFISWNVQLGSFNKILPFCSIGHECKIGDFNEFNPRVAISGNVSIGDCNLFGVGSIVLQGLKIGNYNTIGLGSNIVRDVDCNQEWFGTSARRIK